MKSREVKARGVSKSILKAVWRTILQTFMNSKAYSMNPFYVALRYIYNECCKHALANASHHVMLSLKKY